MFCMFRSPIIVSPTLGFLHLAMIFCRVEYMEKVLMNEGASYTSSSGFQILVCIFEVEKEALLYAIVVLLYSRLQAR